MGSIDKFTKRAKQVLYYAQEEARYFNHPYVGTEHILLGLIRDQDHVAGKVLDELGVKHAQARSAVEFIVGHGEGSNRSEDLELTASAKKVIEYALEEGRKLNHHYVGTEHLLLGLVRKSEGVAAGVLEIMKVNLEQVRASVLRELRGVPEQSSQAQRKPPHLDALSTDRFRRVPEQEARAKQRETSYLDALSTDLTAKVEAGTLHTIFGRLKEIEHLIQISSRLSKNNTVLIGEVGVGKAAIVEGLAQRIVVGYVPEAIKGKRVFKLDVSAFMNVIKVDKQIEERLNRITDELQQSRAILFINELHVLAGASENSSDVAKILKLLVNKINTQIVVSATSEEYSTYIERDPLLKRHLQPVMVNELTIDDTIELLRAIKPHYENFHQVQITDEAIKAAVYLSVQHVHDRLLPDKAIDLIDEACGQVQIPRSATPTARRDVQRDLEAIRKEYHAALKDARYDLARDLKNREARMLEQIKRIETEELKNPGSMYDRPYVTQEDIADIVAVWTDESISNITIDEIMQRMIRLLGLLQRIMTRAT